MNSILPDNIKLGQWSRRKDFEEAVLEQHKVEATVEQYWEKSSRYLNKIQINGKEVIIREQMNKGLTKYVNLIIDDYCEVFKTYKEAEDKAFEYLKG